jgi:hypothetical protein
MGNDVFMKTSSDDGYLGIELYSHEICSEQKHTFWMNLGHLSIQLACERRNDLYYLIFKCIKDCLNNKKYDCCVDEIDFNCSGKSIVLFDDENVSHISIEYVNDQYEVWFCNEDDMVMTKVRICPVSLINFFVDARIDMYKRQIEINKLLMNECRSRMTQYRVNTV